MANEKEEKKEEKKEIKTVKSKQHEQINRSLGYLISISAEVKPLFKNLREAEPLINTKVLKRLAATLYVINKIKGGKTPNEKPEEPKIEN